MKIILWIFSKNEKVPKKIEYKGNYAVETMLLKTTEKYFGLNAASKLEEILK